MDGDNARNPSRHGFTARPLKKQFTPRQFSSKCGMVVTFNMTSSLMPSR